jgi:UDP-N-acetylglucosamine--N-acetylmuramyl-(pentapeptide) pyrophosphoryl-undecaprenol N-acetylglucosamine transferase
VYPALAVVQALESEDSPSTPLRTSPSTPLRTSPSTSIQTRPAEQIQEGYGIGDEHESVEILWVGSSGGMEADLVRRQGLAYQGIPAAGIHGIGIRSMPRNLWQVGRGLMAARRLLRQFRPDVLFFTGGYVAVPLALATRLPALGIPVPANLLYVPDIEPGWALKTLSRFADHIALTVDDSKSYFKDTKDTTVTGYPTRQDLRVWNKPSALEFLKLSPDLLILLVVGGSTGARSINRALLPILPELLGEMQVVHLAGKRDWEEVARAKELLREPQLSAHRNGRSLDSCGFGALTGRCILIGRISPL